MIFIRFCRKNVRYGGVYLDHKLILVEPLTSWVEFSAKRYDTEKYTSAHIIFNNKTQQKYVKTTYFCQQKAFVFELFNIFVIKKVCGVREGRALVHGGQSLERPHVCFSQGDGIFCSTLHFLQEHFTFLQI